MENNKIENKLKKVNELMEQKNYFEEKKKKKAVENLQTEIDGIQIDQRVFEKKYRYERLKNVFSSSMTSFKIKRQEKKIEDNNRRMELLHRRIETLGNQTEEKSKVLLEKYKEIDIQNENIEKLGKDIDLIKINIENVSNEISAKDRTIKSNKKSEQELERTISELRGKLEQNLIEAGTMKKSLDWQADFLREKQKEREDLELEIKDLAIQVAGGVTKKDALKFETQKVEKNIAELTKELELKREEVDGITKKCEQARDHLAGVIRKFEETKTELHKLINQEEELKQEIRTSHDKACVVKTEIIETEDRKREVQFQIVDKEKEANQVKLEIAGLESKLTEAKYVLESKHKKLNLVHLHVGEQRDKMTKLRTKIEDTEKQSNQFDEEKIRLEQTGREYVNQLTGLQSELASLEARLEEKKAEIEDITSEVGVLETRIEAGNEKLENISLKHNAATAEYENLLSIKNTIIKKIAELEKECETANQDLRDIELKKNQVNIDLENKRAEQIAFEREVKTLELSKEKILQELNDLENRSEQAEGFRKELSIKLRDLKQEIEKLNQLKQEIEINTKNTYQDCDNVKAAIADQKREIGQKQHEIDERKQICIKLQNERDQLRTQLQELIDEFDGLKRVFESKTIDKINIEAEVRNLTEKNQAVSNDIKILKDDIVETQKLIQTLRTSELEIKEEIDEKQKRAQVLKEKRSGLQKDAQDSKQKNQELLQVVQNYSDEIVALERTIALMQEEKIQIENQIRSHQVTIKEKAKALSFIRLNNKKIEADIVKLNEIKNSFDDDLSHIKERTELADAQLREESFRAEAIRKEVDKIKKEIESGRLEEKKLKVEIDTYKLLIKDFETEMYNNGEEASQLQKAIIQAKDKLQELEDEVNNKNGELRISRGIVKSKRADLNMINQRSDNYAGQIRELEEKLVVHTKELEETNDLIVNRQKEINIKNTKIEILSDKINSISRECTQRMKDVEDMDSDVLQLDNKITSMEAELKIQLERRGFVEKQLEKTNSKLNQGLNHLANLEHEYENKMTLADNIRNEFKQARKELRDISLRTLSTQREIVKQDAVIDSFDPGEYREAKLPPLPKCLQNRESQKISEDYDKVSTLLLEKYTNLAINILNPGSKKFIVREMDKVIQTLGMIITLSEQVNKMTLGSSVNDLIIQFEITNLKDGTSEEGFKKMLSAHTGDERISLDKWIQTDTSLFGVIKIETGTGKSKRKESIISTEP